MNALEFETFREIKKCIDTEIEPLSSGARVLILKGEGKNFCAGLNLQSLSALQQVDEDRELKEEEESDTARKAMRISDLMREL